MKFSRYGKPWQDGITLAELLALQDKDGMLWAHAEDSGCESCYCEVAQWSEERKRWEKLCFLKTYDVHREHVGVDEDMGDEELATELAKRINEAAGFCGVAVRAPVIHVMPNVEESIEAEAI